MRRLWAMILCALIWASPVHAAIAFSKLTEGESATTAGAVTTASVTLAANALGLVVVTLRDSGAVGTNVITVTSSHGTWVRAVEQKTVDHTSAPVGDRVIGVFRTMGGGATATIAIAGPSGTLGMTWAVVQATGVDTSGSNGAGAVNNASPIASTGNESNFAQPNVTIPGTPAGGDVTFAVTEADDTESSLAQGSGWTNITQFIGTIETSHSLMYHASANQSPTWTGMRAGRVWAAAGTIIKAASGVSRSPVGTLIGVAP